MSVFVLILPNSVGIRGVIHRRVNSMPVGIDFDQFQRLEQQRPSLNGP